MSELSVNKVIIHELRKKQHHSIKSNKYGRSVLDSTNELVIKLVDGIVKIYGKKNNGASYGSFKSGEESTIPFPPKFKEYYQIENPSDQDFMDITKLAMTCLHSRASGSTPASGGYILFADYSINRLQYFVITMIKQRSGITLSEDLEPEELIELDLSKIHQAARISYDKLQKYLDANAEEKKELNYLSFVSPKSSQATAGYFITALGCAAGAASTQATTNVIRETVKFFDQHDLLKDKKKEVKRAVIAYLEERCASNLTAKLSAIEGIARQFMPEDQEVTDPLADELIAHLNSEDVAVPIEFSVSKNAVKKQTHISAKSYNWNLNFAKTALGEDENAQIRYDKEAGRLIIKELPREVKRTIEEELNNR